MTYTLSGMVLGYICAISFETIKACVSCGYFTVACFLASSLALFLFGAFLAIGALL